MIWPPVDGSLGYFLSLPVTNSRAISTVMHDIMFLLMHLWDSFLESFLAQRLDAYVCISEHVTVRFCQIFLYEGCTILCSHEQCMRPLRALPTVCCQTLYSFCFLSVCCPFSYLSL